MNIYLRKILKHDITHQISVTKEVLNGFFNVYEEKEATTMRGKKSGVSGTVSFLLSTDPRFGGDIKQIINAEGGMQEDDILLFVKNNKGYTIEIISKSDERNSIFISMMNIERHLVINIDDEINSTSNHFDEDVNENTSKLSIGKNIILYGVPGCGKSHYIKNNFCDDERYMERIVFHPDYTYSDFVGQILPQTVNGSVSYPFIPGPFTRIMKKAVADKEHTYYLIIEEINRGNAPAIFGEIFQLLDREEGESEYGINNSDIATKVYGDASHSVKIPSNLFILATMNTADQNVFTLDTAFKRRWEMKSIPNDIKKCDFRNQYVCDFDVTWESFFTTINESIILHNDGGVGNEDKRLGAYFVKENELADVELFSEKVLMYLWNDAFKYCHDEIFKDEYDTLEKLIKGFKQVGFQVFSNSISFMSDMQTDDENSSIGIEEYLLDKSDIAKELYEKLHSNLVSNNLDFTFKANKTYIALRHPNNSVFAEIHLHKSKLKLFIYEPKETKYQIGEKVKDTYRWVIDYGVEFNRDSDIELIVGCLLDSYSQVGEKDA